MPDAPLTIGLEEEVLLLDPETLALAPVAQEALDRLEGDERFKAELPSSQLEIALSPAASVSELVRRLADARSDLAAALSGLARPAAAAMHPTAPAIGPLNAGERYDELREEFGVLAERQQVCALQIHVDVGDPAQTIAVHDALRGHLPELAALAANGPLFCGADSGLASMRPMICRLLPRQGVPPELGSAEAWAADLAWGQRAGTMPDERMWWWELRPHPEHGTLELRVPDAQTTVEAVGAVAAVIHALAATLCERHEAGEGLPSPPTWRIEENRWSACRDGLDGSMADLVTGVRQPTRERLHALIDALQPGAMRLGCDAELAAARRLIDAGGGAAAQRACAAEHGVAAVPAWLADAYIPAVPARA